MPTTPLDSHEKVEQVSDTLNLSSSKLISGESCYNAYDGTAIYYRYWLTMPFRGYQTKPVSLCVKSFCYIVVTSIRDA